MAVDVIDRRMKMVLLELVYPERIFHPYSPVPLSVYYSHTSPAYLLTLIACPSVPDYRLIETSYPFNVQSDSSYTGR
jgi:hypothetical protein